MMYAYLKYFGEADTMIWCLICHVMCLRLDTNCVLLVLSIFWVEFLSNIANMVKIFNFTWKCEHQTECRWTLILQCGMKTLEFDWKWGFKRFFVVKSCIAESCIESPHMFLKMIVWKSCVHISYDWFVHMIFKRSYSKIHSDFQYSCPRI